MGKKKYCIDKKEIELLVQDFEKDIADCCSRHVPIYTKMKEASPKTDEFCDLVSEMIGISRTILGKIDAVLHLVKLASDKKLYTKILARKKFVKGMQKGLLKDFQCCRIKIQETSCSGSSSN